MTALNLTALVPMRHQSERVPGKNYRNFAGLPLFHHILHSLQDCSAIDKIVIDTDSPVILGELKTKFPHVAAVERPVNLRDGSIPMNEIIKHDIKQFPSEFYLQTHSTNPLLSAESISRAIALYFQSFPEYDSLFSVTKMQTRLWNDKGRPLNHDPNVLLRTQDLPPVFEENSCIYLFNRNIFLQRNNRIGSHPLMFELDPVESVDIDEEIDFSIAEYLFNQKKAKG